MGRGHSVAVALPLLVAVLVGPLEQPEPVTDPTLRAIEVAEFPDVTAVEVLEDADDVGRLLAEDFEGGCPQVDLFARKPEVLEPTEIRELEAMPRPEE